MQTFILQTVPAYVKLGLMVMDLTAQVSLNLDFTVYYNIISQYTIDIDECDLEPSICGPSAVCVDTFGSYQCILCNSGYSSNGTDCISEFITCVYMTLYTILIWSASMTPPPPPTHSQ